VPSFFFSRVVFFSRLPLSSPQDVSRSRLPPIPGQEKRGHDVSCPYGPIGRWSGNSRWDEEGCLHPVFLQLRILKDFKCRVLKLRILKGLRACFSELRILKKLTVDCSKLKEKRSGTVPPSLFCKRVGKPLMPKELAQCSSLRSAEECENWGVSFWLFLQKSGRVKQERKRGAGTDPTGRADGRGKGVLPSSSAINNEHYITYSY
jgi:hypothetical protein